MRPVLTVLLVLPRFVCRADYGRKGNRPTSIQLSHLANEEMTAAVEVGLGLSPRVGKNVLVLTNNAWTQCLSLPQSSISDLSKQDLTKLLKFELESFSNIPALGSQLSFRRLSEGEGEAEFWVTQIADQEFERLEELVTSKQARLVGVGNPAGAQLLSQTNDSAARVEFWPYMVAAFSADTEPVFFSNNDPQHGRWISGLHKWKESLDLEQVATVAFAPGMEEMEPEIEQTVVGQETLLLHQETALARWFELAEFPRYRELNIPLVLPTPHQFTAKQRHRIAVALACLVLIGCFIHWGIVRGEAHRIQTRMEQIKQAQQTFNDWKQKIQENEKIKESLKEEFNLLRAQRAHLDEFVGLSLDDLDTLIKSLRNAKRLLQSQGADDLQVRRIESDEQGIKIGGIALQAAQISSFADELDRQLSEIGWSVTPPTHKGKNSMSGGGPFTFEMVLVNTREYAEATSSLVEGKEAEPAQRITYQEQILSEVVSP